jgi:hypothetical protein
VLWRDPLGRRRCAARALAAAGSQAHRHGATVVTGEPRQARGYGSDVR